MGVLSRLLAFALLTNCALAAEPMAEVKEGIYRPSDKGSTTLTLWDGQTVRAQWQSELSHRTAKLRSVNNDNTVYQLDIEFPFSEQGERNRYLVTRGVAVSVTYGNKVDQQNDSDVWHHWYNQLQVDSTQADAMQALVAGLKAIQIDRSHPGHVLRTHWKPTTRVFRIGEPVVLQMTLTNAGQEPVSFYDGGMQRGSRNNQFDFICRSGGRGPALPDAGDPMNFGGMAQKITLQPEESLTKEIDITKWFQFKDNGTYDVIGLFHLELQPVEGDNWRVLWEDIAVGQCQISIEPAAAEPVIRDSTK